MEEPVENRFMMTSPVFWYTGALLLLLAIHYGKPRLFFSAKPTTEGVLSSIDKFKVRISDIIIMNPYYWLFSIPIAFNRNNHSLNILLLDS